MRISEDNTCKLIRQFAFPYGITAEVLFPNFLISV
jgi:hypothetical protein